MPETQRVFFALWPDAAVRAGLASLAQSRALLPGARRVPPEHLHLTLAFIGGVEAAQRQRLETAAARVQAAGFELTLAGHVHFARAQVGCLAVAPLPALLNLQARLLAALADEGVALKSATFRPHVTIARRLVHAPAWPDYAPYRWRVREFVLVDSRRGAVPAYTVIGRWPLA